MTMSRDEKWIAVGTRDNYPIFSMIMVYNRETKTQHRIVAILWRWTLLTLTESC